MGHLRVEHHLLGELAEAGLDVSRGGVGVAREDVAPVTLAVDREAFLAQLDEGAERYDISAVIYVMRESQKGIVIGRQGAALKKVGTQARLEMEDFFQKKVFLQIYVKVDPDWRESKRELRKFGYED